MTEGPTAALWGSTTEVRHAMVPCRPIWLYATYAMCWYYHGAVRGKSFVEEGTDDDNKEMGTYAFPRVVTAIYAASDGSIIEVRVSAIIINGKYCIKNEGGGT